MGLFFTLLYILTAYLGPTTVYGDLVEYRVQLITVALAVLFSIPSMPGSGLFRIPQTFAVIGMCWAVLFSFVFNGLTSYAPAAFLDFLPSVFTFFLVVLNCKKKSHLQMIIVVLVAASFFTIYQGFTALRAGDVMSPYLIGQGNDEGERILRLRGLSFISDPNDFAQLLVSLIPLLFFFWNKGSGFKNMFFVVIPSAVLVFGMYLTHSRGAIVALLAVVAISARRKIGTVPAAITAGVLFVGMTALNWAGGRGINAGAGADRMAAWGTGLMLMRSHPFFGVGYERFTEFNEITAHNSIVVTSTELGFIGLFFWILFLLPTVREAVLTGYLSKKKKDDDADSESLLQPAMAGARVNPYAEMRTVRPQNKPAAPRAHAIATNPDLFDEEPQETLPPEEIQRLATLMVICFTGYLVTSWFLSRSYVMTLFIYGGMTQVIFRAAQRSGQAPQPLPTPRLLRLTLITCIGLVALVYIILRVR